MKILFLLLLLAPPMAGCLGDASDGPCDGFRVPFATAGSSFLYSATGFPRTLLHEPTAQYEADASNVFLFGDGGTLQVTLGDEPEIRLDEMARERAAYQASIRLDPLDRPAIDFADEWIDAESGRPIQTVERQHVKRAVGNEHFLMFNHGDAPPLFYAGLFWSVPLHEGAEGTLPLQWRWFDWTSTGHIDWSVEAVRSTDGVCEAEIRIEGTSPSYSETTLYADLVFRSDSALPVRFQNHLHDRPNLSMDLVAFREGGGEALPPFQEQQKLPAGDEPRGPAPKAAMFTQPIPWFDTQFDAAHRAALQNPEVDAWLDLHPTARLTQASHMEGQPDGRILDAWLLRWADGTDTIEVEVANNTEGIPIAEPGGLQAAVRSTNTNGDEKIQEGLDTPWVDVEFLRRITTTHYDALPEVVICPFTPEHDQITCSAGSHFGTQRPRMGESGANLILPGLSFDPRTGRLITDHSLDAAAIGPPVQHPDLEP